ncbi:MAG: NAD-dependent epimerase/dehydratase family protein [Candidatus Aminicenantes bacterium]
MKAFITGGTGFVGSHFIDYYLSKEKDVKIFALVRDLNNLKWLKGLDIHFLKGNLFSLPSLPQDIDYVFHLAGLTLTSNLADYYTVNQQGTASLFKWLHSQKVEPKRVIYLSSFAASGPSIDCQPVKESSPPHPITPYGSSKLMGEAEALKFKDHFPLAILRAAAVYGPRDTDFLRYFELINRRILPTLCSQNRILSLCYVKDLARAVHLCTQKELDSGEIINIADPRPYSWEEFGRTSGEALGKSLIKLKIPLPCLHLIAMASEMIGAAAKKPALLNRYRVKDMKERCWIADVNKAQQKLSWNPAYSLKQGIQETMDWYRRHNWL